MMVQSGQSSKLVYSVEDLSKLTGVGLTKIFAEIRDKRLRARKLGRRTLIRPEDAQQWIDTLPDRDAAP